MELQGKIKAIFETQTRGNFNFRETVITTDEKYPQDIIVQFIQDKCSILDNYKQGDDVTININIRGREWVNEKTGEVKYFTTIQGWNINSALNDLQKKAQATKDLLSNSEDDDLDF